MHQEKNKKYTFAPAKKKKKGGEFWEFFFYK